MQILVALVACCAPVEGLVTTGYDHFVGVGMFESMGPVECEYDALVDISMDGWMDGCISMMMIILMIT